MARTRTACVLVLLISTAASVASAQEAARVIFASASVAELYRADDRNFGTELNVGAGLGIEWKRVGLDAEIQRTVGLTPRAARCSVANVPCIGSAGEGFAEATMLSTNVTYFLGRTRIRPYVSGSVGVLWTENANALTSVSDAGATLSEIRERDTALALGVGFGMDVPLNNFLSLRPEFRTYSAAAMSRVNVGIHRGTIAVRCRW
jgi:hypothetical protein